MATPRKSGDDQRMVSRTYRAAIRIGEDFITMEETIALPLDASDEEVTRRLIWAGESSAPSARPPTRK